MCLSWVTSTTAGHTKVRVPGDTLSRLGIQKLTPPIPTSFQKLATNGIFLVGYALGQILCTQFWKQQYRPRNYVPWGITIGSYVGDWIILIILRVYLQRENARRDRLLLAGSTATSSAGEESGADEKRAQHQHEQHLQESYGYVERIGPDGVLVRQKVEKAFLDLTVRTVISFARYFHQLRLISSCPVPDYIFFGLKSICITGFHHLLLSATPLSIGLKLVAFFHSLQDRENLAFRYVL